METDAMVWDWKDAQDWMQHNWDHRSSVEGDEGLKWGRSSGDGRGGTDERDPHGRIHSTRVLHRCVW